MGLVLELLSRSGKVQKFIRLNGQRFTVGRSYENDIVLEDPYASPYHLSMTINDSMVLLEDKDSLNGVKDTRNKALDISQPIAIGQVFVVGSQAMRIINTTKSVMQTIKMTALEYFAHSINRWYWAVACVSILFAILLFNKYLISYNAIVWPKLIVSPFKPIMLIVALCAFVAFLAHFFSKENKFFTSLVAGVALYIFVLASQGITNIIGFNFGESLFYSLFYSVTKFIYISMAICLFFYFATHLKAKRTLLIAIVSTMMFMGYLYVKNDQANRVTTYPVQKIHVLPSYFLFVSPEPYEAWVNNTHFLFNDASHEAEELNRKAR